MIVEKFKDATLCFPLVKATMPKSCYEECVKVITEMPGIRTMYGAYDDFGSLLGCTGWVLLDDCYCVSWTAVDPKWQHRGIGKMLFSSMYKDLRGKTLHVETYEHPMFFNAIQFYMKQGFKLYQIEPESMQDGEELYSTVYLKKEVK